MKPARLILLLLLFSFTISAQTTDHSIARRWSDTYLFAIRNDFARPVVHARNLYHSSAAMYDTWSLVYGSGSPVFVGDIPLPAYPDREAAAHEAISYAAYRLLLHRYRKAPDVDSIRMAANDLMDELGYDRAYTSSDYTSGPPAALGNYVAERIIAYGMEDGANEALDYANDGYPDPVNPPLHLARPATILNVVDPNHWQPLTFPGQIVDQAGNPIGDTPGFLGASWGRVKPFALADSVRRMPSVEAPIYGESPIYHDPGPPPYWQLEDTSELNFYRWNFETVLKWSSHLDPADSVIWDIGPATRGNQSATLPRSEDDYRAFYDVDGVSEGAGHVLNPATGEPYAPNLAPRGDYTRVVAEYWADGPQSETPPGHWFALFNETMDHPLFERRLGGEGEELDVLEYDVKAYLALGGAMHDAAVTAWSIKGAYDYARPITAIRFLASRGQATVEDHRFYAPGGIRLDAGYIELVDNQDEVANSTALMTVKARAWVGSPRIEDATVDQAGVDWINPTVWEPYQRPDFVSPNFAGYVSGHSTFSGAAATVLELLTGSPYFPGGMLTFLARKNAFLRHEEGPSQDVLLQWATYRDASEESSLSRIWGGIHPPIDDVPGRRAGRQVGRDAYQLALEYFRGERPSSLRRRPQALPLAVYPNPVRAGTELQVRLPGEGISSELELFDVVGRRVAGVRAVGGRAAVPTGGLPAGLYVLRSEDGQAVGKVRVLGY